MAQAIKTPELVDAQAMARKYPETFFVPSDRKLDELQAGDMVMIGAERERFWCGLVRRAEDGGWIGKILNALVMAQTHGLHFGDLIKFGTEHIHQINGDEDDQPCKV